jgi:hypothetical protein
MIITALQPNTLHPIEENIKKAEQAIIARDFEVIQDYLR